MQKSLESLFKKCKKASLASLSMRFFVEYYQTLVDLHPLLCICPADMKTYTNTCPGTVIPSFFSIPPFFRGLECQPIARRTDPLCHNQNKRILFSDEMSYLAMKRNCHICFTHIVKQKKPTWENYTPCGSHCLTFWNEKLLWRKKDSACQGFGG